MSGDADAKKETEKEAEEEEKEEELVVVAAAASCSSQLPRDKSPVDMHHSHQAPCARASEDVVASRLDN